MLIFVLFLLYVSFFFHCYITETHVRQFSICVPFEYTKFSYTFNVPNKFWRSVFKLIENVILKVVQKVCSLGSVEPCKDWRHAPTSLRNCELMALMTWKLQLCSAMIFMDEAVGRNGLHTLCYSWYARMDRLWVTASSVTIQVRIVTKELDWSEMSKIHSYPHFEQLFKCNEGKKIGPMRKRWTMF